MLLKDTYIVLCDSCGKPIDGEVILVPSSKGISTDWVYHSTPTECANADELRMDWRRDAKRKKSKTHNRTRA
jgi:hypothetical protein